MSNNEEGRPVTGGPLFWSQTVELNGQTFDIRTLHWAELPEKTKALIWEAAGRPGPRSDDLFRPYAMEIRKFVGDFGVVLYCVEEDGDTIGDDHFANVEDAMIFAETKYGVRKDAWVSPVL